MKLIIGEDVYILHETEGPTFTYKQIEPYNLNLLRRIPSGSLSSDQFVYQSIPIDGKFYKFEREWKNSN